jgi:hypothetical protein
VPILFCYPFKWDLGEGRAKFLTRQQNGHNGLYPVCSIIQDGQHYCDLNMIVFAVEIVESRTMLNFN